MARIKLLGIRDMAKIEARVNAMGRELYQLMEDYPALDIPDLGYVVSLASIHMQIYDEAMRLKLASLAESRKSGNKAQAEHPAGRQSYKKVAIPQAASNL